MKLKFSYIAYTVVAIALIIGVSRAYALTAPQSNAPVQSEIFAPINHGSELQIKKGSITTEIEGISAGRITPLGFAESFAKGQSVVAANRNVSPWAFFTKTQVKDNIYIGAGSDNSSPLPEITDIPTPGAAPLTINLKGRGNGNNSTSGTTAIKIKAPQNICSSYTTIRTNTPGFEFANVSGQRSDMLANQIRLSGGSPKQNSVLVSVDDQGRTTWATVTIVAGQIQLTKNIESPVKLGASMCN